MQFIKKNYEKVLLGLVLFGLVVAVGFLPFLIMNEREAQEARRDQQFSFHVEPLPPIDTNRLDTAIQQASAPTRLDLSKTNRLFNPVRWLKGPNGPIKVPPEEELQKLVQVTRINPLYLTISLDSVNVLESGTRYGVAVEQQGAASANRRTKRVFYVSVGDKKEAFILRDVKGGDQPDSPAALVLELPDTGERVSIAKGKDYKRVDAYTVDLKSEGSKTYPNRRVGDRIVVSGQPYNIVAIAENEVVMSAPNGKKYTIRYNAGS